MKLKNKIIFTALFPMLVLVVIFLYVSFSTMEDLAVSGTYNGLQSTAVSVKQYIYQNEGDYTVKDGELYKGDLSITKQTSYVDDIYTESNVQVTVYYGNIRYLTSIKDEASGRLTGTEGDESIFNTVSTGCSYLSPKTNIQGTDYIVCYIPLFDNDNNVVGMIFTGTDRESSLADLKSAQIAILTATIVIFVISIIAVFIVSGNIVKRIKDSIAIVSTLADGNLSVKVKKSALNAKDETGDITRAVIKLRNQLKEIVSAITAHSDALKAEANTLSANATRTMDSVAQVDTAINDIANGANNQAEETQNATTAVIEIGSLIEQTAEQAERLADISNNLISSSNEVLTYLTKLYEINKEAQVAIEEIYEQTNTTNNSALKIKKATQLITAIAQETNLLALNASIEAARAGEAGRGFAVVASEIQNLAEQSNTSANTINEIINLLIADSNQAVETMNNVKNVMEVQSNSVTETNKLFNDMRKDMDASIDAIGDITSHTQVIDNSRQTVVDVVQNLSAIAEENAASAEETSASIVEVNELTQYIGERAERLDTVSTELAEAMNFFTINN